MKLKRIVGFLVAMVMFSAVLTSVSAETIEFSDLGSDHWAYSAVMQLVSDGTVNGMGDGTYAPNKLVTRAEFAKMIGKIDTRFETDFADLTSAHWSYEYVMWSGINGDSNNNFRPDEPMLRDDVVFSLWKRNGSPSGAVAPSVVTDQSEHKTAAAWAYSYGLMIGNDGIDLRLDEGISRAEVASLIVRSRSLPEVPVTSFANIANEDVLKAVFEGTGAFDKPYSSDGTLTYGELSRAALRLASESYELTYAGYNAEEPFDHKYAKDLYVLGDFCLGEEKVTAEYIDKPVNNIDMLTMLTFALIRKSHEVIAYNSRISKYADTPDISNSSAVTCISYAKSNGVQLFSGDCIKPHETASIKTIAAALLQLDYIVGSMSYYEVDGETVTPKDISISRDFSIYPENAGDFRCILDDTPAVLYTAPFLNMPKIDGSFGDNPVAMFDFARVMYGLFAKLISMDIVKIKTEKGVVIKATYYPQLVCDNTKGFTARLKIQVVSLGGNAYTYADVFNLADGTDGSKPLSDGMIFYTDVHMPYDLGSAPGISMTFGNIVYVEG